MELPTVEHCQESNPRNDPSAVQNSGKNLSKSDLVSSKSCDDLNLPIACRKGIRSCTKHPMSNFMSFDHLSSSFTAFISQLSNVEIPKNIQDALKIPKWKEAILEEIRALEKNKTWEVMSLP